MNMKGISREEAEKNYAIIIESCQDNPLALEEAERQLCLKDLYYLLAFVLKREDARRDFVFYLCRLVQSNPDGFLDIWAREHYKSTIITFALTIQEILKDPEITIGIFSFTRPIARTFLQQIKYEFESNSTLKRLFGPQAPDKHYILYGNPKKEAKTWGYDTGLTVRRKKNPKEATLEAWGVYAGQPTGRHFQLRVYDDIVVRDSVQTKEKISKTTDYWELSLNLGTDGGKERYVGTRYHRMDTYQTMIKRGGD